MERINNRKYGLTANDLTFLGCEMERVLEAIKKHEYGRFNASKLELKTQLALRIIEGMDDWQWQHNKGIRVHRDTHVSVEIYDLHELQKSTDKMMDLDLYDFAND